MIQKRILMCLVFFFNFVSPFLGELNSDFVETLAASVDSSHDCFFVPAFGGLLCPYWEDDARGYSNHV